MNHEIGVLVTIAAAAGFGILAQVLAHRWQIPAIVLLLGFGIALGEDVLGIVQPHELSSGIGILVKLSVAIILFEGALNLNLRALRRSAVEIRNLVTWGALLSGGFTAVIVHFVAGFPWTLAALFGALMTVTGPTVVQPLMRRIDVSRRLKTILEGEAILIDPIGAILAIAVLDVLLAMSVRGVSGLSGLFWAYFGRLLVGGVVGGLGALGLARLMKAPHLVPLELSNLVALASVWVTFGVAERLQAEAGIMAAVVMGLVAQGADLPNVRRLRRFKETLTTLGISMLFILLAANLETSALWAGGVSGVLAVLLVMLVARPAAVLLATRRTALSWREKLFIAWVGPRGIIAASVASLFAIALDSAGIAGGQELLGLTFLTIILTVTVQGLTAGWLGRVLRLNQMEGEKVLIVGANTLGCAVARVLEDHGRPTLLLDTNPTSVERVCLQGMNVKLGNALEEQTLDDVHAGEYATFLALTSNSEVNVLACQLVQDAFGNERAFPALSNPAKGANPKLVQQSGGRLAFAGFIDFLAWERGGEIHRLIWRVPDRQPDSRARDRRLPEGLVPVLRLRQENAEIVHADQVWQARDEIVLISNRSKEQAQAALQEMAAAAQPAAG